MGLCATPAVRDRQLLIVGFPTSNRWGMGHSSLFHEPRWVDRMSRFWLSDETNNLTDVFTVGATLSIEGRGLHPSTLYDFHFLSQSPNEPDTLLARYSTDRDGALAATPLIPYVGLSHQGATYSQPCAHGTVSGQSFVIRAAISGVTDPECDKLTFTVTPQNRTRRIFACDGKGRLQTRILKGSGPVVASLHNFPAGCVRVYLVHRQSGWRVGDRIEPVSTRKGALCSRTMYHDGAAERMVTLVESNDLPAGSYQLIARVFPAGWHQAESTLLRDDVVSDRQNASLVILLPFPERFNHDGAIFPWSEVEGHPLAHRPLSPTSQYCPCRD